MNILPKKRWHVRTKENIARVRRDEAKAAEEQKVNEARVKQAESEARISYLKQRMKEKGHVESEPISKPSSSTKPEHINFFADLEAGKDKTCRTNPEYEKEKKEEQEKYERQIGYLTYLGKNLNDVPGKLWYEDIPRRNTYTKSNEKSEKSKTLLDPIHDIKRYLDMMSKDKDPKKEKHEYKSEKSKKNDIPLKRDKKRSKSKKEKRHKLDKIKSSIDIEKLRAERLVRENTERLRTEALLAKLRGEPLPAPAETPKTTVRQKYNSQFFPELARQNAERTPR